MKVVTHLTLSSGLIAFGVVSLGILVSNFPPDGNRKITVIIAVYVLFFFAVYGLASLAGLGARGLLSGGGLRHEFVRTANRQAILLGLMAVVLLMMQATRVFSPWSAGLLLAVFLLLEVYIR